MTLILDIYKYINKFDYTWDVGTFFKNGFSFFGRFNAENCGRMYVVCI